MIFTKEYLNSVVSEDEGELIEEEIIERDRWTVLYRIIFKADNGRLYESFYRVGATEMQDESPYEYDDDEIECNEVKPVKTVVTIYERV